jgi:hypothetical protein
MDDLQDTNFKGAIKSIMIGCFYLNIFQIIASTVVFFWVSSNISTISIERIEEVNTWLTIPAIGSLILWGYCMYFYYKFDRYSFALPKLFFLIGLYSPYYFYRVIWKRRRTLENTDCESEPVLGRTIHLETEEEPSDK